METAQQLLMYLALALAAGFLVWKYLIPKGRLGKKSGKSCGQDNCGCG